MSPQFLSESSFSKTLQSLLSNSGFRQENIATFKSISVSLDNFVKNDSASEYALGTSSVFASILSNKNFKPDYLAPLEFLIKNTSDRAAGEALYSFNEMLHRKNFTPQHVVLFRGVSEHIIKNTSGDVTADAFVVAGNLLSNPKFNSECMETMLFLAKNLSNNALISAFAALNKLLSHPDFKSESIALFKKASESIIKGTSEKQKAQFFSELECLVSNSKFKPEYMGIVETLAKNPVGNTGDQLDGFSRILSNPSFKPEHIRLVELISKNTERATAITFQYLDHLLSNPSFQNEHIAVVEDIIKSVSEAAVMNVIYSFDRFLHQHKFLNAKDINGLKSIAKWMDVNSDIINSSHSLMLSLAEFVSSPNYSPENLEQFKAAADWIVKNLDKNDFTDAFEAMPSLLCRPNIQFKPARTGVALFDKYAAGTAPVVDENLINGIKMVMKIQKTIRLELTDTIISKYARVALSRWLENPDFKVEYLDSFNKTLDWIIANTRDLAKDSPNFNQPGREFEFCFYILASLAPGIMPGISNTNTVAEIQARMSEYKELGIEFFERFNPKILENIYLSSTGKIKTNKTALVILNKNDWNGAFLHHQQIYESLIDKGYSLIACEAKDENEVADRYFGNGHLVASKEGKKYDLVILGGHGSPASINFGSGGGEMSDIDLSDFGQNAKFQVGSFAPMLKPGARWIDISCSNAGEVQQSTGPGNPGNFKNIMKFISALAPNATIFAPKIPTNLSELKFDANGNVTDAVWYEKGAGAKINASY